QALLQQRADNFGIENPRYQCLPEGSELHPGRRLQENHSDSSTDRHPARRSHFPPNPMDGRTLETDPNPNWMGYSVGRWKGDTLVVESNGYNDRTWLIQGYPHTEALRLTERFRRTDFGRGGVIGISDKCRERRIAISPRKSLSVLLKG